MFKKASKSVCTSTIVVSPDPVSPITSTYSVRKTPENTEENPHDPQPSDEEYKQMQYSFDYFCSPSKGAVKKKSPSRALVSIGTTRKSSTCPVPCLSD
jgi:hypothetical protein